MVLEARGLVSRVEGSRFLLRAVEGHGGTEHEEPSAAVWGRSRGGSLPRQKPSTTQMDALSSSSAEWVRECHQIGMIGILRAQNILSHP